MNRQIGALVVVAGLFLIGLGILIFGCDALVWQITGGHPVQRRSPAVLCAAGFNANHLAGVEPAFLSAAPLLLSQHQAIRLVSFQTQFARRFL